jgi:hypothetical protein
MSFSSFSCPDEAETRVAFSIRKSSGCVQTTHSPIGSKSAHRSLRPLRGPAIHFVYKKGGCSPGLFHQANTRVLIPAYLY